LEQTRKVVAVAAASIAGEVVQFEKLGDEWAELFAGGGKPMHRIESSPLAQTQTSLRASSESLAHAD
jgi:hypothetical protein